MEIKTDAIVLRATDYKDADKILTLLTPSEGKITAGIKGVKKSGARLAFAAQPFAFCEYVLTEKNGRRTVVSAYQHDGFFPLRTDVVRFYAACSVAEICDALCPEGAENESLFVAAAETLRSLAYGKETCAEAICSFLLTALFESGYMIDLDGCGACGREIGGEKDGRCFFDFFEGRFLCDECGSLAKTAATANGSAAGNMRGELARASVSTYLFLRKCGGNFDDFSGKEENAAGAIGKDHASAAADGSDGTEKRRAFSDKETYGTGREYGAAAFATEQNDDGDVRALRLLKTYLTRKTEREYPCFSEFFNMYAADREKQPRK